MKYTKKVVRVGHMLYVPIPTREARLHDVVQGSLVDLAFSRDLFTVRFTAWRTRDVAPVAPCKKRK